MRNDVEQVVARYKDDIFRAALVITKNIDDAEDVMQETFIAYMKYVTEFESDAHIRAWLIRVAVNKAKDLVKTYWNRNTEGLNEFLSETSFVRPEDRTLVDAVLSLPAKYREIIYLYYYEGYSIREIADIYSMSENTVKSRMARGRKRLKVMLKEDWSDDE